MRDLHRWLDGEARRNAARPALEESLLAGRTIRYVLHRLRFVVLGGAVSYGVHLLEFSFLMKLFASGGLGLSFGVRSAAFLAAGFWWGALELLRMRVRESPEPQENANEISGWLSVASGLAIALCLGLSAYLGIHWARTGDPPGILHAYLAVVVFRLACDLVVRTVYSGVYARRRVYRPVPAIVLVDTVGLAATLLLWGLTGPWAVPAGLAISVLVSRGIVLRYTLRAYDLGRAPRPRLTGRRFVVLNAVDIRVLLAAGLAQASSRVGSLLVLALLLRDRGSAGDLSRAIHLVAPLLATAASWAQVFYLDFIRLADVSTAALRRRLEQGLERTSLAVGLVLLVVTAGLATFGDGLSFRTAGVLGPVFLIQSYVGYQQVRHFGLGHFGRTLRAFAGSALGVPLFVLLIRFVPDLPEDLAVSAGAAGVLGTCLVLLHGRLPSGDNSLRGPFRSVFSWVHTLAGLEHSVRVGSGSAELATPRQRRAITQWVTERIGREGGVTVWRRTILWFEHGHSQRVDASALAVAGGGLVGHVRLEQSVNGRQALRSDPVRSLAADLLPEDPPQVPGLALVARFRDSFPQGIVAAVETGNDLRTVTAGDRREIWSAALAHSRGLKARRGQTYDVTALLEGGEIRWVFAVPMTVNGVARRRWRSLVDGANWHAATQRQDPAPKTDPTQVHGDVAETAFRRAHPQR